MTANTDEHEQLRLIFLEQVGHLITDGTIETRSLKRAGMSFACGNLHAAFLAWQAARRAPIVSSRPTVDQVSDAIGYHSSGWDCANPDELIDVVLRLAAAPEPPEARVREELAQSFNRGAQTLVEATESARQMVKSMEVCGQLLAAPVQLPEPDAGWFKYDKVSCCWHPQYSEYAETHAKREGWQKLYTEQQVRQLLAAQEQST